MAHYFSEIQIYKQNYAYKSMTNLKHTFNKVCLQR